MNASFPHHRCGAAAGALCVARESPPPFLVSLLIRNLAAEPSASPPEPSAAEKGRRHNTQPSASLTRPLLLPHRLAFCLAARASPTQQIKAGSFAALQAKPFEQRESKSCA
ncbi:hypothetical protein PIB30_044541 [Stylosanthes scabra]|uniref:Uncharacterized protein n=1 Tax=Stylosanthes scabra TaxID=79078 RepID=A0ABU6TFJ2_9FABA|nr:hypothetical protein [Stylosanthes scabra]